VLRRKARHTETSRSGVLLEQERQARSRTARPESRKETKGSAKPQAVQTADDAACHGEGSSAVGCSMLLIEDNQQWREQNGEDGAYRPPSALDAS
jgi:hypothetical protein